VHKSFRVKRLSVHEADWVYNQTLGLKNWQLVTGGFPVVLPLLVGSPSWCRIRDRKEYLYIFLDEVPNIVDAEC